MAQAPGAAIKQVASALIGWSFHAAEASSLPAIHADASSRCRRIARGTLTSIEWLREPSTAALPERQSLCSRVYSLRRAAFHRHVHLYNPRSTSVSAAKCQHGTPAVEAPLSLPSKLPHRTSK